MSAGGNRTSAAKAGYHGNLYGTAEAVPFQDRVLTQTLQHLPTAIAGAKEQGWGVCRYKSQPMVCMTEQKRVLTHALKAHPVAPEVARVKSCPNTKRSYPGSHVFHQLGWVEGR